MFETRRLVLRRFTQDDWHDLHEYLSMESVMRYLPEEPFSEDECKAFARERASEGTHWAVCLKDSAKLIGHVLLRQEHNPAFQIMELGYVFNPAYHKQGYAEEACRRIIRHGFTDLSAHRIIATCDPENTSSWRLLERLNMRREAHFVRCLYLRKPAEGEAIDWRDEFAYAILSDEWEREDICEC